MRPSQTPPQLCHNECEFYEFKVRHLPEFMGRNLATGDTRLVTRSHRRRQRQLPKVVNANKFNFIVIRSIMGFGDGGGEGDNGAQNAILNEE